MKKIQCLLTQAKIGYRDAYVLITQNDKDENIAFEALTKSDNINFMLQRVELFTRFGIGEYFDIEININDEGELVTQNDIKKYQKIVKTKSDIDINRELLASLREKLIID
jgi:hypothetical protein